MRLLRFLFPTFLILCLSSFAFFANTRATEAASNDSHAIREIELTPPPIDFNDLNRVWRYIKREVGAPEDFPPPPLVLDWEVPAIAKLGFQYPTTEFPDHRLQISLAPRTIDNYGSLMLLWGIGHELAHYAFLLADNDFDLSRKVFGEGRKHHCNEDFMRITRGVADEIWNIYHGTMARSKMYDEVIKTCSNHPNQ